MEERHVQSHVHVLGLFPLEVGIGRGLCGNDGLDVAGQDGGAVERADEVGRGVLVDVSLQAVGGTEVEFVKPLGSLHELLLPCPPESAEGVERQVTVFLCHAEDIGAVETDGAAECVAVGEGVGTCGKPRHVGIFLMALLIEGIALGDAFVGENDGLGGEGAGIEAVGGGGEDACLHVAHFGTAHEFNVVLLGKALVPFEHRLPGPLVGVPLGALVHAAVGEDGLALAVYHVGGVGFCLAHGIGVVAGIAGEGVVVVLQAVLGGEFQMLVELEFSIENRHDGTVLALLGGVVTLLEDVEVGGFVLAPLHVQIIIVIAVGIVWLEVRVRHA